MFANIEEAIINRIKASALGAHVKTVDGRQKAIADLGKGLITSSLPAIYVAFMGGPTTRKGQYHQQTARFTLAVMTQSLYSQKDAKEKTNVGAYAIVQSLLTLFAGHTLGLNAITPLIPESVEAQEPDDNLAQYGVMIFTLTFSTSYIIEAANADASARGMMTEDDIEAALKEIITNYALMPGGNFATPAASGAVTLTTP